jgi:hypothetical protein
MNIRSVINQVKRGIILVINSLAAPLLSLLESSLDLLIIIITGIIRNMMSSSVSATIPGPFI